MDLQKLKKFNLLYFSLIHIFSLFAIYKIYTNECNIYLYIFNILLYLISTLGITAGSHRLWTHKSYEASFLLRIILMIFSSIANQGSIYHWVRDHIIHHKFSDKEEDPHNINNGFFYAHMGWLLVEKSEKTINIGKSLNLQHLKDDCIVMFQKNNNKILSILLCFVLPTLIPYYYWNENLVNSFYITNLRYTLLLHFTWCINSVSHTFGYKPYDKNIKACENLFTSFFALGEGWHNWHHKYPWDYAASENNIFKINITKYFIDICCLMGLAWNRKTVQKNFMKKKF